MEFSHVSVLLRETIDSLAIRPDGIYIDGTAGGAGHSCEIAKRLTTGRLIAIDKDPQSGQQPNGLPPIRRPPSYRTTSETCVSSHRRRASSGQMVFCSIWGFLPSSLTMRPGGSPITAMHRSTCECPNRA